jgi:hypothetical protein
MRMRVGNKTVLVFKINMTKSEPKQTKLMSSSALCWLSGRNRPSSSSSDLSHSRTRLLPKEAVLLVVFFGSKCHPSPLPLSSPTCACFAYRCPPSAFDSHDHFHPYFPPSLDTPDVSLSSIPYTDSLPPSSLFCGRPFNCYHLTFVALM